MGKYWDNICAMQKRQTEKGLKKYGFTLENNHELTDIQRIEYLQEEMIDALMYCEHLKEILRGAQKVDSKETPINVCGYCYFLNLCSRAGAKWDKSETHCLLRFCPDKKAFPSKPEEAMKIIEKLREIGAMI